MWERVNFEKKVKFGQFWLLWRGVGGFPLFLVGTRTNFGGNYAGIVAEQSHKNM